ncbi:proline dehydrogenase family protein [Mycolicibacterium confluentis]|uniref:proline dehydrogenase n=1 Tax=Mycolicibacterium confluentis TaxID=28047 RepID=A0A7I7XSR8_9MYCO|nr:proline dehydrogenase family protein [Mycolicibacterium confluentis]MCV7321248.1 proline dehydrogenase family protein [Mycolicibacterium confluentis]ORV25271.1 proline dehydrogenase [Mycolicibacterium confluentis]BBZ32275.1 putative proline dehydrogenase [Mycolicibacterium confluentis]
MTRLFDTLARPAILTASHSHGLKRSAERIPLTRRVVQRFVPGETVEDVLSAVADLRYSGRMVSIDHLGEDVIDTGAADANVQVYLRLLDLLGERGEANPEGVAPLEVSLKLSALGQALDRDGEKIALENAHLICTRAREVGAWVTVDAEDHTTTDSTLLIVRELRADFPWLGTVLQAYLRRTYGDCQEFAASGARIRLCKGAYDEPAAVAHRNPDEVTASYVRCLRVLMAGSGYPMVASHDPAVIDAVAGIARECGRGAGDFEYQMLYGIRDAEQVRLADAGANIRVYVPFGTQWFGYFMRRLAERPANLAFFARALVQRG